jgi:hypothetical protein
VCRISDIVLEGLGSGAGAGTVDPRQNHQLLTDAISRFLLARAKEIEARRWASNSSNRR